jgi:hypothetical protein
MRNRALNSIHDPTIVVPGISKVLRRSNDTQLLHLFDARTSRYAHTLPLIRAWALRAKLTV